MSHRYLAYRIGWTAVATLVVVSVMFLVASLVPDYTARSEVWAAIEAGADESEIAEMEADLGLDGPLHLQYVDWVVSTLTFDWGTSQVYGEPVADLLADRLPVTLAYVLPAALIGTSGAVVCGYVAAVNEGERADRSLAAGVYLTLAVPNFVIAAAVTRYVDRAHPDWIAQSYDIEASVAASGNRLWLAFATVVLGTHLMATQIRYVRAQSSEYLASTFVKLARSTGQSPRGIARHVLRASAAPILTVSASEIVGVLVVSIFVLEAVFGIEGVGYVTWQAAVEGDQAVILAITTLLAVTIVLANLLQDLLALALDPRMGRG